MLKGLWREVVLDNNRRIERGEVVNKDKPQGLAICTLHRPNISVAVRQFVQTANKLNIISVIEYRSFFPQI